jgi:hypothetical protein
MQHAIVKLVQPVVPDKAMSSCNLGQLWAKRDDAMSYRYVTRVSQDTNVPGQCIEFHQSTIANVNPPAKFEFLATNSLLADDECIMAHSHDAECIETHDYNACVFILPYFLHHSNTPRAHSLTGLSFLTEA